MRALRDSSVSHHSSCNYYCASQLDALADLNEIHSVLLKVCQAYDSRVALLSASVLAGWSRGFLCDALSDKWHLHPKYLSQNFADTIMCSL